MRPTSDAQWKTAKREESSLTWNMDSSIDLLWLFVLLHLLWWEEILKIWRCKSGSTIRCTMILESIRETMRIAIQTSVLAFACILWMPQLVNNTTQNFFQNSLTVYYLYVKKSENESLSVMSDSLWLQGLQPTRLLCPWNSLSKNTGVDSHSLILGIFPTQGSNPGLLLSH